LLPVARLLPVSRLIVRGRGLFFLLLHEMIEQERWSQAASAAAWVSRGLGAPRGRRG
jgi:hypothetical protein